MILIDAHKDPMKTILLLQRKKIRHGHMSTNTVSEWQTGVADYEALLAQHAWCQLRKAGHCAHDFTSPLTHLLSSAVLKSHALHRSSNPSPIISHL